jgi:small subunit ribosomal protein S2
MAMPTFTMRQLLEAGVHFGHTTRRWNPKMQKFIFGERNGVHIIDLEQTVPLLHRALESLRDVAAGGGRILFVGTKRQAAEVVSESAKRCGQYFVNHRWLGGMLTTWKTISNSIKRLKVLEDQLSGETTGLTKKELLGLQRERDKLDRALGGIKEMAGLPDILFVIDTNKEAIAIHEATKLNIPVIAIIDSNCDPEGITYPVPGNDDAMRAIHLYCDLVSGAVIDGLQQEFIGTGNEATDEMPGAVEALPDAGEAAVPAAAAPVAGTDAPSAVPGEAAAPAEAPKTEADTPAAAPVETAEPAEATKTEADAPAAAPVETAAPAEPATEETKTA